MFSRLKKTEKKLCTASIEIVDFKQGMVTCPAFAHYIDLFEEKQFL